MSAVVHTAIGASNRIATGGMLLGGIVEAIADGIEMRRIEEMSAVERLVAELARARQDAAAYATEAARSRQAAAVHAAEAARLRRELSTCGAALGAERTRAERAERALDGVARAAGYVRTA